MLELLGRVQSESSRAKACVYARAFALFFAKIVNVANAVLGVSLFFCSVTFVRILLTIRFAPPHIS